MSTTLYMTSFGEVQHEESFFFFFLKHQKPHILKDSYNPTITFNIFRLSDQITQIKPILLTLCID